MTTIANTSLSASLGMCQTGLMNTTIIMQISLIGAIAAYFASAGQIVLHKAQSTNARLGIALAVTAVLLHVAYISISLVERGNLNGSFVEMFSVTALIVVLVALISARDIPSLFVPLNTIAAIALLSTLLFRGQYTPISAISPALSAHIALSLVAYGVLCTAALTAVIFWFADRGIRKRSDQVWLNALPPLQRIESLMFGLISVGWVLLTIGITIGVFGIDDFFAQQLAHKAVFSIISWLLFAALLLGRQFKGWRGSIAVRWTLVAFSLLAVAFLGSKFVLDVILGRL